jgi:hypothetical protein
MVTFIWKVSQPYSASSSSQTDSEKDLEKFKIVATTGSKLPSQTTATELEPDGDRGSLVWYSGSNLFSMSKVSAKSLLAAKANGHPGTYDFESAAKNGLYMNLYAS